MLSELNPPNQKDLYHFRHSTLKQIGTNQNPKHSQPHQQVAEKATRQHPNEQPKDETHEPLKINTMEVDNPDTKPMTPINPDPTQNVPPERSPISRPNVDPLFPPELPPIHRPTKLKLAAPKPFTGNREDLNGFLLNLNLYLTVNREIYDDSFKKIGYALSFMMTGDAKSWKDQYLEESNKGEYLDLGTWSEFTKALKESFEPYGAPGDTMDKIINLKKGDATIKDHIVKYKVLLRKAKIPEDSLLVIDYFMRSLPIPLQRDLLRLSTPPKDLKE